MMIWQSVKRTWAHIDKDAGRECCIRPLHLINGEFPRTQPKEQRRRHIGQLRHTWLKDSQR